MIEEIVLTFIILSWISAAVCNAVMDVLAFKYKRSIFKTLNPNFWNPKISWKNKYKNKNEKEGSAFFGSTTFLVFTTDAWHLFQFFCNSFIILGIILAFNLHKDVPLWLNIIFFISLKITWGVPFELAYSKIFRDGR